MAAVAAVMDIIERPRSERFHRVVIGADPAAGAEFTVVCPGGVSWRVLSLSVEFTSSAAAATRVPRLVFDDQTTTIWRLTTVSGQVASITRRYTWALRLSPLGLDDGTWQYPLPELVLLPGMRLLSSTVNIQGGDDYGAPVLYVEQAELAGPRYEAELELFRRAALLPPEPEEP